MTRNEQLQSLIQLYKSETSEVAVDMELVAHWAMRRGVTMPKPKTPVELLAAQFSDAARAEYRQDPKTGWSYRVNHAVRNKRPDGRQLTLWVNIEDAKRSQMHASLSNRRQQIVHDAVHMKIDETMWNRLHPEQEPLQSILDFTEDVDERLNSPGFDSGEGAA